MVVGTPRNLGDATSVFAYGNRDDPARLVVLLADCVLTVSDPSSAAASNARTCLEPRTTWRRRLDCLGSALHDVASRIEKPFIALWDADALSADKTETWDQERSALLQRDLSRLVRAAVMNGGWILVRTARAHASTTPTVFDDLDLEHEVAAPDANQGPEEARLFAPECWPIASWLVSRGVLRPRDLVEVERTVARADEHLVDLAYEALPGVAREAALLLTALRAPQPLNGHYGRLPFEAGASRASASALPAATRAVLMESGLIQPTWLDGPWRMPRIVRNRLAHLAQMMIEDEAQQIHRAEAELGPGDFMAALRVEAHYHAICTGDAELAKRTAVYYGSELSEVATRLSVEAQDLEDDSAKRERFMAAANLFHHIVETFDETDAYAWEYYGFNLARAGSPDRPEILDAYRLAHTLRRGNPLYHGRWLGFRAELGQQVVDEAIDGVQRYAMDPPERESVSFFAEAILSGLWRGAQRQQARKLLTSCGALLERLAPRVMSKAAWAR
jgi:hypothetical protein